MASQIKETLSKVTSALKALGIFDGVATVEPKKPTNGLQAAVFAASIQPAEQASGLNAASGRYVFTLRIYTDMLKEPAHRIDPELVATVDKVFDALMGGFTLGDTVLEIDVFGRHGEQLRAEYGHIEVNGTMERIVDITLPLIIDNTWELQP